MNKYEKPKFTSTYTIMKNVSQILIQTVFVSQIALQHSFK